MGKKAIVIILVISSCAMISSIAAIFLRSFILTVVTTLLVLVNLLAFLICIRFTKSTGESDRSAIAGLSASIEKYDTLLDALMPALDLLVAEDEAIRAASRSARTPVPPLDTSLPPLERLRKFTEAFAIPDTTPLTRLKAFADLNDGVQRLQAIELRLPYVEALLERVVNHTENAALILTERFGSITEQTESAEKKAKETIAALGMTGDTEESLDALVRQSHETIINSSTAINDFIRLNKENTERIRKLSNLVAKSVELITGIEDIAERSKLITFNLAVESAKIGEKGLGFKVIVTELQRLNEQTTDFARDILEIVKSFRTSNQELLDLWLVKAESLTDKVKTESTQAEAAVTALLRSYDATGTLFRSLSESAVTVNQAMEDVLSSLQFQDITRQQIEGVSAFLADIKNRVKEMRGLLESMGFLPGNQEDMYKEIRSNFTPKLKVTSDHSIFDTIERRQT